MLKALNQEVSHMLDSKHVFWEVQNMIRSNASIQKSNIFYSWLAKNYIVDLLVRIRHQAYGVRKDDISFARLLKEIMADPHVLSRKRFERLYKGNSNAQRDFEKFYGWKKVIRKQHINQAMIKRDLANLERIARKLARYTNKRVAHLTNARIRTVPTFNQTNPSIDYLEKLVIKYELILNGANYGETIFPTFQYEWQDIFRVPWIRN